MATETAVETAIAISAAGAAIIGAMEIEIATEIETAIAMPAVGGTVTGTGIATATETAIASNGPPTAAHRGRVPSNRAKRRKANNTGTRVSKVSKVSRVNKASKGSKGSKDSKDSRGNRANRGRSVVAVGARGIGVAAANGTSTDSSAPRNRTAGNRSRAIRARCRERRICRRHRPSRA